MSREYAHTIKNEPTTDNPMTQTDPREEAPKRQWFVMRAYKCEKRAEEALGAEGGLPFFIPKHYAVRSCFGRKQLRLVPVIPGLVFVHASREELLAFKRRHDFLQFTTSRRRAGGSECLVVPDEQMEAFIRVASRYEEEVVYCRPEEIDLERGTRVRVVGGAFDGVQGLFVKVRGRRNRRVVVLLDRVAAVTAEVSPDLLEVLS